MQELFDQLDGANILLKRALKKYFEASSAVLKFYDQASSGGIPVELSDRVTREFSSLGSFERKLKRVKAAIGQVRNHYCPTITIHSLPPEILSRVFSYVVGLRPCGVKERSGNIITFPKYPDLLTHVCSHWRRITLDQPDLWSHIDIVPFHNMSPGFHARAKAAAARAKLLDVHCYEPSFAYDYDQNPTYRLLKRIGPQIRSLELVVSAISECFNVDNILAQCLKYSVAGIFDQLTIVNPGSDVPIFLLPRDPNDDSDDFEVGDVDNLPGPQLSIMISPGHLDEILLPLSILRLDGVYFPWNHSVYHNLAELRLLSSRDPETAGGITSSQLVDILTYSPRLQVLHFDISIRAEHPDGAPVLPVHLEQLRTLSLAPREHSEIGSVLRLLAPGQNAPKLSMKLKKGNLPVYDEHTIKFFERSNVEILRIVVMPGSTTSHPTHHASFFDELIRPLRQLRILILQELYMFRRDDPEPVLDGGSPGPIQRLDAVYMIQCTVEVSLIQQMVLKYQPKTLTIWRAYFRDQGAYLSTQELEAAFSSDTCRFISFGDDEPNPIRYWD